VSPGQRGGDERRGGGELARAGEDGRAAIEAPFGSGPPANGGGSLSLSGRGISARGRTVWEMTMLIFLRVPSSRASKKQPTAG
jgi:hypothetical protein